MEQEVVQLMQLILGKIRLIAIYKASSFEQVTEITRHGCFIRGELI